MAHQLGCHPALVDHSFCLIFIRGVTALQYTNGLSKKLSYFICNAISFLLCHLTYFIKLNIKHITNTNGCLKTYNYPWLKMQNVAFQDGTSTLLIQNILLSSSNLNITISCLHLEFRRISNRWIAKQTSHIGQQHMQEVFINQLVGIDVWHHTRSKHKYIHSR